MVAVMCKVYVCVCGGIGVGDFVGVIEWCSVLSYLENGALLSSVSLSLTPPLSLFPHVSLAQASSLCGGVCTSSWCVSCSAAWYCSVMATVARRAAGHAHIL